MVFIGDVWYYWKLVADDDIGGRGGGSGGGGGVGTGTGHIGVYLDSGDGDKTVMEKLLTSYMGEWCRCWCGAVGGNDYGVHDESMVPCDNLFTFGAGWENDHGELMRLVDNNLRTW